MIYCSNERHTFLKTCGDTLQSIDVKHTEEVTSKHRASLIAEYMLAMSCDKSCQKLFKLAHHRMGLQV